MKQLFELDIIDSIDISNVKKILENNTNLWDIDTFRQEAYRVHSKTKSIVLKWTDNYDYTDIRENADLIQLFEPFITEILTKLDNKFKYKNPHVFKMVFGLLPSNCTIAKHIDQKKILQLPNRIHIPIITNPDVITYINKNEHYMKEGIIYNFNNTMSHEVINNSHKDRVHLIIDYYDIDEFNYKCLT
jgi:aspartyl/asparaginyl beta-hydroxylase (cupin superfamily)